MVKNDNANLKSDKHPCGIDHKRHQVTGTFEIVIETKTNYCHETKDSYFICISFPDNLFRTGNEAF